MRGADNRPDTPASGPAPAAPLPNALLGLARPNPMVWENEEPAQGVFVGLGDAVDLLGVPTLDPRARAPRLPSDFRPTPELIALFEAVREALVRAAAGGEARVFDLRGLDRTARQAVEEILGDGEVSVVAGVEPIYQAQESVLTGVWQVRAATDDGAVVVDQIEVAPIPSIVRAAAASLAETIPPTPDPLPPGVMNVAAVLAEIRARAAAWAPGRPSHTLNFTLFPMTEADTEVLTATLGRRPLTIVSGGFGACRIMATRGRNVWAVQYENAMGKSILDTLEIGDVPEVACAAPEDFERSAERLTEIMEAYLA